MSADEDPSRTAVRSMIIIRDYQSSWPEEFESIRSSLLEVLGALALRIDGNPNQRYPLLFRDYLRVHPNSARSIELIKREIAKRHTEDWDAYYAIKDPIYDLIWEATLEWAKQTGWQLSE